MTTINPLSIEETINQVPALTRDPYSGGSISITNPNPGIQIHVASQLPEFVSEDHPKFIQFMEHYYRWMESKGQTLHESRLLKQNRDIDLTSEDYEEHLFNEFLSVVPRSIVADKALVLKYIKQFYTARGTEKSFKFLFRILFNSDSSIYHPKTDILRVSDGKWIQNKTIRIVNPSADVRSFRAKKIRGLINNSTAFVERVYGINFGAYTAYELVLNRSSITGKFLAGEKIVIDGGATATITPILESIKIIKPGKNYVVGDKFFIENHGTGGIIRVAETDEYGAIKKFYIEEYGIGYNADIPPSGMYLTNMDHPRYMPGGVVTNPDTAVVDISLGSTTNYPGYFRNEDGQASAMKYIHDGYYYQQFSYVTYCGESSDKYESVLDKVLHPLGYKRFSGVSIENTVSAQSRLGGDKSTVVLNLGQSPTDAQIQKTTTEIIPIIDPDGDNVLGPTYRSIMRDKFSYKPFIKYDTNIEMVGDNSLYYGPKTISSKQVNKLSSTPVSAFSYGKLCRDVELDSSGTSVRAIIGPRHIETNPTKKTSFLPDSFVILDADRIQIDVPTTALKFNVGDSTKSTVFNITFATGVQLSTKPIAWKIKLNGFNNIFSGTITSPVDVSIPLTISFVSSVANSYTWDIDLNGTTVRHTVSHNEFRLALFLEDDLGRTHKSSNIGVKYHVA